MSVFNKIQYLAKRFAIGLWGPAELPRERDPRTEAKVEYVQKEQEEEQQQPEAG